MALVAATAWAAEPPVHYLFDVVLPAGVTPIAYPAAAWYDTRHAEFYVADAGNRRVVIFDREGNYLFEFSDPEQIITPRSIAVDSLGRILMLLERPAGRLRIFDYDGSFLRDVQLTAAGTDSALDAHSFTLDEQNHLYVLTGHPSRIHVFSMEGEALYDFPLFEDFEEEIREQPVMGNLSWIAGQLAIPLPILAQVAMYSPQGKLTRITGHAGGGAVGEMSFPISVTATPNGGLLVLDKHRPALLQYSPEGRFIREFGGMGASRGWFYHPHIVCADGMGRYFVLQSCMNRIQAVQIPGEKLPAAELRLSVAEPAAAGRP